MTLLPSLLYKAEEIFIEYEKFNNIYKAKNIQRFIDAHLIVRSYLNSHPDTPHRDYCMKLRTIYTRSFLRASFDIDMDFNSWLSLNSVLFDLSENLSPSFIQEPDLLIAYDDVRSRFKDHPYLPVVIEELKIQLNKP